MPGKKYFSEIRSKTTRVNASTLLNLGRILAPVKIWRGLIELHLLFYTSVLNPQIHDRLIIATWNKNPGWCKASLEWHITDKEIEINQA